MEKSRRKFIGITVGAIMTGGLAGCMDNQNNNDDNNNTTDSNPDNVDNDNNSDDSSGDVIDNVNSYIEESASEIRCTNNAENVNNIGLNKNGNYNFSGTKKLESSCYSVDIDSTIIDQKLIVDVSLFESDQDCSECVSDTEPQLSYSGVVFVEDSSDVTDSEINVIIN